MPYDNEKQYRPLIPANERMPMSRWKASQIKSKWLTVKQDNFSMNEAFMFLLRRIKNLYAGSGVMVYERDHRNGKFNPTAMYNFVTIDLYLELECEYASHKCELFYDFSNCQHEAQIAKWLKEYPFSVRAIRKTPPGGIPAYFDRILAFQGDKHFHFL